MSSGAAWPIKAQPAALRRLSGEPIWFEWLALLGLFVFASWLLGVRGVWSLLLTSDPTGITFIIILVFLVSTLWCGARARELSAERAELLQAARALRQNPAAGSATLEPGDLAGAQEAAPGSSAQEAPAPADDAGPPGRAKAVRGWGAEYWRDVRRGGRDSGAPIEVLLERTHGPHSTAWWVNGIQLKLGLLGKVIGFSVLALQIGQIQNFDPSQSQELLKSLTQGLGIALLTTMVGLVGNILLGLQLTRLDRYADEIVALAQQLGSELCPAATPPGTADTPPRG